MPQNGSTVAPQLAPFSPPPDNLHEAIEALHSAQITGDYRYPALALAGPLMAEVGRIFPQNFIVIYLLTSYKKRQGWNAYLAKMFADPAKPTPIIDPNEVRYKLMHTRSAVLLEEAYGMIPDGYERALGLLGLEGQQPEVYIQLHEQMSSSAELRKSYSHASTIDASTISTVNTLPDELKSYNVAKQFRGTADVKNMIIMIEALARGNQETHTEICEKIVAAAQRGHAVSGVLRRVYYQTPFPAQAVPDSEHCKHIANALELKKAAKQFSNCLGSYAEEGIRGELQYYRWFEFGRPVAVISVREDHPYGFRIVEIKGKKNAHPDDELESQIIAHFEDHGIRKMETMEAMLQELSSMAMLTDHPDYDAVDAINNVIDSLLDVGSPK